MSAFRGVWIYAGLLVAAFAVAMATNRSTPSSQSASIRNPGPSGIRALYLYLEETGFEVMHQDDSLKQIPEKVETLVIPAPRLRRFERAELAAVRSFVERGGTLVYLAARPLGSVQAELDRWLDLREGEWLQPELFRIREVKSSSPRPEVELWLPALKEARRLGVSGGRGVEVESHDALPIAGSPRAVYGWWRELGGGEVWVFAGSDFAENSRIEEADNIELWQRLAARGPMLFDESHHRLALPASGAAARALWIVAGQFLACALFFSYARGARLGPPRPEIAERHRSSREYLESIARLTRRARVEKELLPEAIGRVRLAMQDRLGIAVSLPEAEAARALEDRCQIPAERLLGLGQRVRQALALRTVSAARFAQIARACAELERIIAGH